jgi:hypothetical protein
MDGVILIGTLQGCNVPKKGLDVYYFQSVVKKYTLFSYKFNPKMKDIFEQLPVQVMH